MKILMATDGSEHSEKTLDEAIKMAGSLGAEVTVITIMEDPPSLAYMVPSELMAKAKESHEKSSRDILAKAENKLRQKGIAATTLLRSGHPADVICKVADEGKYDMIVIGSRGLSGITELLLGSVSNRVVHCAKTSVYIVK